jgi:nitrite reductase/ring-hydroxylating ferredoxin subunit
LKNNKIFYKSLFFASLFLTLPLGCVEEIDEVIPDVPVNVTLPLIHYNLSPASSMIVTNQMVSALSLGYDNNGIIIYCDVSEYYAYDRTCPHHVEKSIPVEISDNPLYAECPECHSLFQLWFNGFPTDDSPSKYPLKQYKTTYYPNSNSLHIYN